MSDASPDSAESSAGNAGRTLPRSMRLRNRAVAEREAARLARPERTGLTTALGHASKKKSAVSSTPVGYGFGLAKKTSARAGGANNGGGGHEDEWCGPFSVARQMIAAREEARKKREAEQLEQADGGNGSKESHPLDDYIKGVELQKKHKANPSMLWRGSVNQEATKNRNYYAKRRRRFEQQQGGLVGTGNFGGKRVPSLFRQCVDYIVHHFEDVEALGNVDSSIRRSICESLVAKGKMNGAAFDAIAEAGIEALELVDCAEVTQDQLSEALELLIPSGLRALVLNHCGRCFGSKAVNAIVSSPNSNSIFAISLGGAYMLKDIDAASLVSATASTLSSISLKACPLIGNKLCCALGERFSSTSGNGCLLELSLEDLNLSKECLLSIGASSDALRNLKNLTLKQIQAVDDEVISILLGATGGALEGVDLSENNELTDDSLSHIRRCNKDGKLRALQLRGLKNLTAAGLEALFTHGIPGVPSPPMLRKLDLSSCDQDAVCDVVLCLAAAASSMKRTADGEGAQSRMTGSEDLPVALSTMGGLVHVNVSGSSVTDKSMESLAATCSSSLKELDVSFSPSVSDKGLGFLVSKAQSQFAKLHIWGCAQITDEFLDGHSRADDGGLEIIGVWMKQSGGRSLR